MSRTPTIEQRPETQGQIPITEMGKATLLAATALALLATPLVAPAMKDLAIAYAGQVEQEPLAQGILWLIAFLPGEADVNFLVKFILLSVPALLIVICAPIAGYVADHYGRRSLLIFSLITFALSGVSGYFVDTFTGLFIGRAFLGLSIAGIKTSTVAMCGDLFQGSERTKFIGKQGSAMKVGGVVFMLLGGYLASIHWSLPFWAYLLAFVALPGAIWSLVESMPEKLAATSDAQKEKLPRGPICFVFASAFLASMLFYIVPVQMNFLLSDAFQLPNFYTGLTVASANAVSAIVALYFLSFKSRLSYVQIFSFIFLVMGLGYTLVSFAPNYWVVLLGMLIGGLGFGLIVPAQSAWIMDLISPQQRAFGVGLVTTAMFLGQFVTPIILQPFIVPDDPFQVYVSASKALFILAAVYGLVGFRHLVTSEFSFWRVRK